MVLFELAMIALPIAERILYRFLDGPEQELRRKKLRLEIDQAIEARSQNLPKNQFAGLREAVYIELQAIINQLPDIECRQNPIGINPVIINRSAAPGEDVKATLNRLSLAIESRRRILSTDTSVSGYEESSSSIRAKTGDVPSNKGPHGWVKVEDKESGPSRLDDLKRRIEKRRNE